MRDSKHIQDLLGLPALAVIPQTKFQVKEVEGEQSAGPEILWDTRSSFSESIRVFRTAVMLSSAARQSRVITVTSVSRRRQVNGIDKSGRSAGPGR